MVAAAPMFFCVGSLPSDMRRSAGACGALPPPAVASARPTCNSSHTKMGGFMANIMTPILSCWQPPLATCGTPSRPMPRNTTATTKSISSTTVAMVSPIADRYPQQRLNQRIRDPHANDVLCGRGGSSNRHVGNLNFRSLVAANKEMYVSLTKKQKMMVARKLVDTIHHQEPPGRFLQKDLGKGLWFDIGLPRSLEKTSQALREKTSSAHDDALSDVGTDPGTDPGCHSPTPVSPQVSPPGTAQSSPVTSSASKAKPVVEIPEICIPEHLEAQFRPQGPRMKTRNPIRPGPPLPSWDYHHPPPPSQPYLHPYPVTPGHAFSHFRHPHSVYSSGPPPPYDHPSQQPHRSQKPHPFQHPHSSQNPQQTHPSQHPHHRDYRQPYSLPPHPHHTPSYHHSRQLSPYPPMTTSGPPPNYYLSHPVHPIPPSPDRPSEYRVPLSTQTHSASPRRTSTVPRQLPSTPPSSTTSSSSISNHREKMDISPGRSQAQKKQRHHSPTSKTNGEHAVAVSRQQNSKNSTSSLSQDLQHRLTLEDRGAREMISPTSISQSRVSVRRSVAVSEGKDPHPPNALAGLAALSSAAWMKLDEGEKVKPK